MPLVRTLRKRSSSVAVTLPKALAEALDWAPGTRVEIEMAGAGRDTIILRSLRKRTEAPADPAA